MSRDRMGPALILGFERISAWAKLLDEINVFPVADGDTGRNLLLSLAPLRNFGDGRQETLHRLLMSARGHSGNIAARFFSRLVEADAVSKIPEAVRIGAEAAGTAVRDPLPGTMLTVFDEMARVLRDRDSFNLDGPAVEDLVFQLEKAVRSTPDLLPPLREAGVVDSGALGMYIFFEGFFWGLLEEKRQFISVPALFENLVSVSTRTVAGPDSGYCVDTVVQVTSDTQKGALRLSEDWDSVLTIPCDEFLKVHLHTPDRDKARKDIAAMGRIISWSDDDLREQVTRFRERKADPCPHVMTDAAGSVTRSDSETLGMTVLDSYITAGEKSLPETLFSSQALYDQMGKGVRVSTSQASDFERYQHYQRVVSRYDRILYLCVGSVYTGNYDAVTRWKRDHDPKDRLKVLDTGTASGQLGTIALLTARLAAQSKDPEAVMAFAKKAISQCREYVFLDKLHYLAAGGRLSKTSAFFGDVLHMKPIIRPMADGAQKVGVVRHQKDQVRFALQKLGQSLSKDPDAFIMLEYSDNRKWVEETVMPEITRRYPFSEIRQQPLSLTSGAHMGPGTWGIAMMPKTVLFKDAK